MYTGHITVSVNHVRLNSSFCKVYICFTTLLNMGTVQYSVSTLCCLKYKYMYDLIESQENKNQK